MFLLWSVGRSACSPSLPFREEEHGEAIGTLKLERRIELSALLTTDSQLTAVVVDYVFCTQDMIDERSDESPEQLKLALATEALYLLGIVGLDDFKFTPSYGSPSVDLLARH
jgi:hypothetical protein